MMKSISKFVHPAVSHSVVYHLPISPSCDYILLSLSVTLWRENNCAIFSDIEILEVYKHSLANHPAIFEYNFKQQEMISFFS
mmetsp:Transcript_24207/g.35554  ORF Transcript_24207/g.35554 Transcript_24207/m.35554 type:complete len:82 (-) Transcript_24207:28-273(-)